MNQHDFCFEHKVVPAIVPQSRTAGGTVNGATILEPWQIGRSIAFILSAGDLSSVTVLGVKVQRRLRSDGSTWSDVPDYGGSTDLEFTAAKTIDGGELESSVLVGSLSLERFDGVTYDALRLMVHTVTGATVLISAVAVISNLLKNPSTQTDDLILKQIHVS